MQIVTAFDPLRMAVEDLRRDGRIALVPTMGALHEGHLALVRAARDLATHVIVSIFVNPRQFGPGEDLAAYPRRLESDSRILEAQGVSLLWAPGVETMYPAGFSTTITVDGAGDGLCGAERPGHFDGVATVVAKLFNQVRPDIAVFGEKDWQQLTVIRRMARDLDLSQPHASAIIGIPTVRESDGLAMSSRNAYLSDEQRAQAACLPAGMRSAIARIAAGDDPQAVLASLRSGLVSGGFVSVDYAELRDAETLEPVSTVSARPVRLFVAARIGKARLIDNMAVQSI